MVNGTSYGTASPNTRSNVHESLIDPTDEERAALLSKPDHPRSTVTRLRNHFAADIDRAWADLVLLAGYFITGLLDSSSIIIWGGFVSMQTGNTVYLGTGLVAPTESDRWIRAGISIGAFCLGSVVFAAFHHACGQRERWVMVAAFTAQLLFVVAAAIIVTIGPVVHAGDPIQVWSSLPLALLAFQSAGQAFTSRALKYSALSSVVLTSIYCDLFSDPLLLRDLRGNVERNRRAAAPVLLLLGAMAGGAFAHSPWGLAGAFWTVAILKLSLVVTWVFWPAEKEASS